MARPLRIQYPGAFYHVMNRGTARQEIFHPEGGDRALFQQTLRDAVQLWQIKIHAYSLMDNHYHLLVETPLGNLSRALRHIDGVYTQRFNRHHHRDGPLLRGRFKSILVQQETYLLELVRYIHLNGVRAGHYPTAAEDPHCSHKYYLHPSLCPDWLTVNFVLSSFFNEPRQNHPQSSEIFDQFVMSGVDDKLKDILDRKRWPAVLGQSEFVEKIASLYLNSNHPRKDCPQEKALIKSTVVPQEKIIEHVSRLYNVPSHLLIRVTKGKSNPARVAAMVLLRYKSLLTYGEIGRVMGGVSGAAVQRIIGVRSPCHD